MEIIIDSKKNNPLLNRTEVQFTIKHEGESTPNREIVRNELADMLNTKKENIIINNITSGFGTCETSGYAKVYTSLKQIKGVERKHFLKRNKLISDKKKDDKKDEKAEKPAPTEEKSEETITPAKEETPAEPAKEEEKPEETAPAEDKPEEKPAEPAPAEDKPEETSESAKEEEKSEDTSSDSDDKKDANVEEEKKE